MSSIILLNTLRKRRSIHTFKREEIDLEIIKNIFSYATYAPTHYMKEPWRVKLFQGKGKEDFVHSILTSYNRTGLITNVEDSKQKKMMESMRSFLMNIPHHALIYFETEDDPIRYEEDYSAVCAFIQNAQLAAWEYGVGMLWTITPYMHDPEFYRAVGLDPHNIKIAAVLQIGYPKSVPRDKGRTPIEEKLEIIDR